ncbi:MAG: hypothetical protein Ct9H300mP18_10890 [Candidatus Neomarinimicrobiota bacterium]|nr:MAG: hypothetical protein Ct9H300mP18_10890 [Candidatus Neomarinimicrobiota bacterium]
MIRKYIYLILLPIVLLNACSQKKEIDKYLSAVWNSPSGGSINYLYRSPDKLEKDKKYPMLFSSWRRWSGFR